MSLGRKEFLKRVFPFSFSLLIIIIDQITKFLVVKEIPLYSIKYTFFGDFLRIIHVRNKAVAFSIGSELPDVFRLVLFSWLPLIVLFILVLYVVKASDISRFQRWVFAGIVGGGFGNLIDRFFRPEGVVDFVDVKFYGLLGMERWPTFNVADSTIVVCSILLFVSLLFSGNGKPVKK